MNRDKHNRTHTIARLLVQWGTGMVLGAMVALIDIKSSFIFGASFYLLGQLIAYHFPYRKYEK